MALLFTIYSPQLERKTNVQSRMKVKNVRCSHERRQEQTQQSELPNQGCSLRAILILEEWRYFGGGNPRPPYTQYNYVVIKPHLTKKKLYVVL